MFNNSLEVVDFIVLKTGLRNFIKQQHPEEDLRSWFDPLTLRDGDAEKSISVAFPHAFFSTWFSTHGKVILESAVQEYLGADVRVLYDSPISTTEEPTPIEAEQPIIREKACTFSNQLSKKALFSNQFTFDTFLHNNKNVFPVASAKEVAKAESPPKYNPLVIAGPSGSGKTHLLRAIAHSIIEKHGDDAVFLGNIEDIAALYKDCTATSRFEIRKQLARTQFFLLDDLQRLQEYPSLQDELIALFDMFHDAQKQMVFCCTDALTAHEFLLPTLRSRLEWGLLAQLKPQDMDIRIRYATGQLKANGIKLTNEQILLLCQQYEDFRLLQGVLLKLVAFKDLMHTEVSEYDFTQIIEHTETTKVAPLTADTIIRVVADHYSLHTKDLLSEKRHQKIVLARQIAMYLTRTTLSLSYPVLGRIFGGKDHSTVIYAFNKIKKSIVTNKDMKLLINELKEKCLNESK